MVDSITSPKRRRTDGGPATADAVAQSDLALQVFRRNRQNRWMASTVIQPAAAGNSARETNATAAAPNGIASNGVRPGGSAQGMNVQGSSTKESNQEAARWESVLTAAVAADGRSAPVVDVAFPYVAPPITAGATAQIGRKSLEPQAGTATARQGLPSPAPSEGDSIQSPLPIDGSMPAPTAAPRRGPERPRNEFATALRRSGSPTVRQILPADPARNGQSQNNAHSRRVSSGSGPAVRNPSRLQTQTNAPSPLQSAQSHPFRPGAPSPALTGRPTIIQRPSNANAHYATGGQPPVFVPLITQYPLEAKKHFVQLFNVPALLGIVDFRSHQLALADPDGTLYRSDQGRLNLLKQAVEQQDSFYVVLSQLYCLRTTSPSSLPQAVSQMIVREDSWKQLEALLCPNESLLPSNVAWFAAFPSPIMTIYSSEHPAFKSAYETQVRAVAECLIKLPQQWQAMTEESIAREAPPLAQDMAERLSLHSPILQNTVFRAIARFYFARAELSNSEDGIETLMRLHHLDQTQYAQGIRRTAVQKSNAYLAYRLLFSTWKRYDAWAKRHIERQNDPNYQFRDQPLIPFQIPAESLAAFGLQVPPSQNMPPSQTLSGQNMVPGQPQQYHPQQQHGHPVQQREASTSVQSVNLTLPQQSHAIQHNTPALAQQQQVLPRPAMQGGPAHTTQPQQSAKLPLPRLSRLLPSATDPARPQPTHPDSVRSALHQAHLRDPILIAAKVGEKTPKLYRQVDHVCLTPTRIHRHRPTQLLTFKVDDDPATTVPKQTPGGVGTLSREMITETTKQYRLRCGRIDTDTGFPTLSSWLETDNIWPDTVWFNLNGVPLDARKKLQHGRYLPIDLTHLVRLGSNELQITVNRTSKDTTPFDYAVAVERVGVSSHETLLSKIPTIPESESLASLKQSLSGPTPTPTTTDAPADDDDIQLISNSLTIKLLDPFSGTRIFTTPVRGALCLHRDPFDLDIYLSTREPRNRSPETPSAVDTWRCPICRRDARPEMLVVDGFLVGVRRDLEARGVAGGCRAIVVDAQGEWRVKAEEMKGVRSGSLEREERGKDGKGPVEVIELD
ncbi:hypothetical protein LTR35_015771 [Friedmanniomyces endolithicus]|nr:hypothetical protein LTR35_015771 [Friedmanniomyces endolithicus]KAK0275817.1 hypothetical protein LTS00_014850 [Friedmanniomyces endolithicus]KAK0979559.1 hypothetical protein LTR54_015572 [Friedmanniomyces endolithicus]